MNFVIEFLTVVIGFVILIKGADLLIEGASSLAKKFSIPEIVIGLTIVAFGTSAPELIVNIFAALEGSSEIVFGNVIGSSSFNIILILGVAGIIYPISVLRNTIIKEIPFSIFTIALLFFLANDTMFFNTEVDELTRYDGGVLILYFILFLIYVFIISKSHTASEEEISELTPVRTGIYIVLGMAGLFGGGKLVVDGSVNIARIFNVSEKLIALTIVSGGTSLPELVTSAMAAYKRKCELAVGNVIGSNIFNILLVTGASALVRPVYFDQVFNFDIAVLMFSTVLLFSAMYVGVRNVLQKWQSVVFLMIYVAYMTFLIYRK